MIFPLERRTRNPLDIHVGGRVRARRKILRVSLERLASAADITFQQVRNYENGINRISASTLYEIAKLLRVPIAYFFEGLPDPITGESDSADAIAYRFLEEFVGTPEGMELARNFPRIVNSADRSQVLKIVRTKASNAPKGNIRKKPIASAVDA